jgi:hypothetical protein
VPGGSTRDGLTPERRPPARVLATLHNRSQLRAEQSSPIRTNLNARETDRDAPPALGRTAEAVPKGYSDWVHQARVFPGPPGSRPARSLIYTHSGDTYKATIGRPRKRYASSARPGSAAANAGTAGGEESGSAVIAIVVTDRLVEIWSQEPAQGWANPSLVPHDEITNIQYLR